MSTEAARTIHARVARAGVVVFMNIHYSSEHLRAHPEVKQVTIDVNPDDLRTVGCRSLTGQRMPNLQALESWAHRPAFTLAFAKQAALARRKKASFR